MDEFFEWRARETEIMADSAMLAFGPGIDEEAFSTSRMSEDEFEQK